jgi:hypothetical protein
MEELLTRFETKAPEIVFEWHDAAFACLMAGEKEISQEAIFNDVTAMIAAALPRSLACAAVDRQHRLRQHPRAIRSKKEFLP